MDENLLHTGTEPSVPLPDFLERLSSGAWVMGESGVIIAVNTGLKKLCGPETIGVVGKTIHDWYDEAGAAVLSTMLDINQPPGEIEHYLPRDIQAAAPEEPADGDTRLPALLSWGPWVDGRLVVTAIDLSRYHAMYTEVTRLGDTVIAQARDLRQSNLVLEERVRERTRQLDEANREAIVMLAVASEAKDQDTGEHVRRIQSLAESLALALGYDAPAAERLGYSAVLHDVGKMKVPDEILKKPGRLNDEERARMQVHTIAGEAILSHKPFFDTARVIARSHHENFDGSGYPDGLAGGAIPPEAMIVHIVDVFDALTHPRIYKDAWPVEKSIEVLREESGRMFDPEIVSVFLKTLDHPA